MGLRYFKTGNMSYSEYMSKESPFKLLASIFIFTGVLMTLFFFHEFTKEEYFGISTGILVDLLWLLFLITFFYWYMKIKK
jgi:Na+/proline symporter